MERQHVLLVVFLLVFLADDSSGWSGNHYVVRTDTYWVYHRTCGTWCLSHHTVKQPRQRDVTQCCPGWKTSSSENCNIPVCNPPCQNGGTCVASQGSCAVRRYSCTCPRNVCQCPVQHSGRDCANTTVVRDAVSVSQR
ncbi:epidermal growth factor-like protein 7 [Littorina saxatilis]|uniref:Uncharacterized protein n=1 Tax=Littorina saxatilis TaxID=31220 RepID=A0AAN9B0G4_9CAEN